MSYKWQSEEARKEYEAFGWPEHTDLIGKFSDDQTKSGFDAGYCAAKFKYATLDWAKERGLLPKLEESK